MISSVYTFAIGLYVLKMTGSGFSFAVTLTLQILPTVLLGPFAGVLADRIPKKKMVIATDAFNGLAFIAFYFISRQGLQLSAIYTVIFLVSVSQTLYNICVDTAIPDLVSGSRILKLNSVSKIIDSLSSIVSPFLGGVLYALVDMRVLILANAVAYLLSTLAECFINFSLYSQSGNSAGSIEVLKDLKEGLGYIRQTGWIRKCLINFAMINFFLSFCYSVPVPYILNNLFKLSGSQYGIVQCFVPLGMIIGAVLVQKTNEKIRYEKIMLVTGILFSVMLFLIGILPAFAGKLSSFVIIPYYGVLFLGLGIIISEVDIPVINSLQTRVPVEVRGRVLSISISIIKAITPVSFLISGAVVGLIPAFIPPLAGGIFLLILYFCLHKYILEAEPDQTASEAA